MDLRTAMRRQQLECTDADIAEMERLRSLLIGESKHVQERTEKEIAMLLREGAL